MKKTLIALAALASTAAFAQSSVTLSGSLAAGYAGSTTGTTTTKGFGVDTANFKLSTTQDLGGGMKVEGYMGVEGVAGGLNTKPSAYSATATDSSLKPNNAGLKLSGDFGSAEIYNAKEACNGIIGAASAGAPTKVDLGKFACAAGNNDNFVYTAPKFGDVTAKVLMGEDGAKATDYNGVGKGNVGSTIVYFDYAAGPVAAGINFTNYKDSLAAKNNRTRVTASYDLGVAKIGAGYSKGGVTAGQKNDQTSVGVSVPMGAWTLGAQVARASVTDVAAATQAAGSAVAGSYTQNVSSVGAKYAFSKTTSVLANYYRTNEKAGSTYNAAAPSTATTATALVKSGYQLLLVTNF